MKRYAVITIDVQNDCSLPGSVMEVPGTYERRGAMQVVLEKARACGMPIIHVVRLYNEDGGNVDAFRKPSFLAGAKCLVTGTHGAEILGDLLPQNAPKLDCERLLAGEFQELGPNEWAMYKSRFGAFYRTELEAFLRDQGVDTLVFMGCNFPNCPRTTIFEACERDFNLIVVKDALSGLYERGEEELKRIGVRLINASDEAIRMV